jgi:ABC-type multidrug transport system permease subunit
MLLMPVAMMWFFGGMGGSGSADPPRISLTVVDHDREWLSRAVVDELHDESVNLRELTPDEAASAADTVRTLVLPVGFTSEVLAGNQQVLQLLKEPGSNDQFAFAAQTHITRAIVRATARLIEMELAGDDAPAPDVRFRDLARREPLVALDVSTAGRGRPVPSGRAQSVPGIMTFVVLMMTLIYGAVFLTVEKRSGMLRRQSIAPLGRTRIFAGKLLGRLLIAGIQVVILVLAGRFVFGVSWGDSPAGLSLVLASYTFAVAGLATFLGALLRTPEQASAVGWIGAMVMAAIGGCWWPSELMPGWLWTVGHAFPTAWAMDAFHALISFGGGVRDVVVPAAALAGFGALSTLLGARFLRVDG